MTKLKSLRERVAEAIRADGSDLCDQPWDQLADERKIGWLGDADRAIPVVLHAAARVADQRDPDNPYKFLFKRERIGDVIKGLFMGCSQADDELWFSSEDVASIIEEILPYVGCDHMDEDELNREKELGNGSIDLILRARQAASFLRQ